ncbi:Probable sensor-like histidine kinase YehU [uncultured Ruminococcus sp.]|uniref:Histidine kinase n=1 Tax=Massiliimalia timonensis TaxID=1987501 RepID=A0A8J6TP01_9FIRM|nr:histidine kinase [Massiliimalia timonensis]MBC8609624.1 histidine kinase [Massiliimalia timonensis]SCH34231.1 Probable sensor-like histidine kinase YehU [uncultured Ruminococcus sp.]SCH36742.1 Probable sensor-like histidine kinase YehU [uncultured Clostridium sp.]
MKRISIIEKTNLIVILIVVTIGVAFGYTVYARTVRMVDQENRQTVEYVFDLMDSTLSSLYQQVDNLIKNVSLNQEVRHYYQRSTSVDPTENARRFSEYLDILKSTTPSFKTIKLYRLDGELIYRAGDSPIEFPKDLLPENIDSMLKEVKGRQYWMHDKVGGQDMVRVFSYIYNLYTLELMGILEVQIRSQSLFVNQAEQLDQTLEVLLMEKGKDCIWQLGRIQEADIRKDIYKMREGDEVFSSEDGQYQIYQRAASSQVGNFYLVKATSDLKKINQGFLLYIIFIFLIISVFILMIASGVLRRTLIPVVRLTKLVNQADPEAGLKPSEQEEINKIKAHQDEVGLLAKSFDSLLGKIQTNIANIRQANHSKRKLEFELLMSQIKPHFLYNTIEAICGIAQMGKNEDVYQIAKSLGVFYRLSLSKGKHILPIQTELAHIKSYLDIERIRSNYSFNYYIQMQEGIGGLPLLKMILQPMVENAVEHGIRGMMSCGGMISVTARLDQGDALIFEVMDNGKGIAPEILEQLNNGTYQSKEQNGFGMNNVRERIKMYYTEGFELRYDSVVGYGTKVILRLNGKPDEEE